MTWPDYAILAVIVFDYIVVSQSAAGVGQVIASLAVIVLTIVGTFFRGPNWAWVWPWAL